MNTIKKMTVRLLRVGRSIDDALSANFAPGGRRALIREEWSQSNGAELIYGQIYSNTPGWTSFVAEGLFGGQVRESPPNDELLSLETAGAGCALFIPVGNRMMTVCFGTIHLALDDDAFERQFGLKVALNAVSRSSLRTLDLSTPDAVTFQRRIQASKDSDVGDFGVDAAQDLARVAGGTPRDETFARFVAGRDSLSLTCEVSVESVQEKCLEILEMYESRTYREEYPWVDQVIKVREKDVIEKLDAALFRAIYNLRAGGHEDLHLAPPEIVDYTAGSELRFSGFGGEKKSFSHLSIEGYVSELDSRGFTGGIETIRGRHVVEAVVSDSGTFAEKWKIYRCFVYDTTLEGAEGDDQYILSAGSWHRVSQRYRQRVECFFEEIERRAVIGGTSCKNEKELIADLEAKRNDLLKLDEVKINPGGVARAQIEPCDFLSRNGEFIHIKDGESSGPISHLWSQGVVSIDALLSDDTFVEELRNEVAARDHDFLDVLPEDGGDVVRERLSVVYAVMRRPYRDGSIGIPFFSKVSAQPSIQYIRKLGVSVGIELIPKETRDE